VMNGLPMSNDKVFTIGAVLLANPSQVILGDRVTHLVYDVPKR
jgi:hypothetical protein